MFKFMKSKKGFSLVELMIVVVIMAILVAVAVPIYNSVTGKSRAKTCIDNQRQIISVISNDIMLNNRTNVTESFAVEYNGKEASYDDGSNTIYTEEYLGKLFQTIPYCPSDGSSISVSISGNSVTPTCTTMGDDSDNPHALNPDGSGSGS